MEQETKSCPYCGEEIMAVAKKCKYCGEWLKEDQSKDTRKQMISCPICSEMIEEGTEICPHCNERLTMLNNTAKTIKSETEDDGARSFFDYYLWDPFFRHYADFKGRLNRKHYWISQFVWMLSLIAFVIMFPVGTYVLAPLFLVASIIPLYATAARRMLDGDSVPGAAGWISLFLPSIFWWLIKPTEPRLEDLEDIGPDNPQPVKFKKADRVVCIVYAILFIIGIVGFNIYSNTYKKIDNTETDDIEKITDTNSIDDIIDKQTQRDVKEAYIDFLARLDAMDEDQVFGQYFLFDITGDGIPEIWVESGTCAADHTISVFTYNNKLTILDAGEEGNASYASFYKGENYILLTRAHLGYADWTKISYHNGKLVEENVFEENLNESGKDDYAIPTEPAVESYSFEDTEPIISMFGDL